MVRNSFRPIIIRPASSSAMGGHLMAPSFFNVSPTSCGRHGWLVLRQCF
jgi:hypothetical protein